MSILVNAVDTFYSTKNEAVFSASKSENIKEMSQILILIIIQKIPCIFLVMIKKFL